ncbi:MAG: hypothetical protein KAH00_07310 [Cocleimonas sp.]|nr:hypothetical protein [Cocleimonas sp.]
MSALIYVIRGYQFGYNDECLYVEGNRIDSMFPDKQQAEAVYKKLEVKAARGFNLSDVESIFESEPSFLTQLDQFVGETCDEHILKDGHIEYGVMLPKKMKDDDVLTFIGMAKMQSYQLLAFDHDEKFYAIWLPKEKTYATEISEGLGSLIYEQSKQDLTPHICDLIDYQDWNPTIISGKLSDISPSPVLLEHIINRDKSVHYSETKQTLKISGYKASTYMSINSFLSKPFFEIKALSIHEIKEIEKELGNKYMKEWE